MELRRRNFLRLLSYSAFGAATLGIGTTSAGCGSDGGEQPLGGTGGDGTGGGGTSGGGNGGVTAEATEATRTALAGFVDTLAPGDPVEVRAQAVLDWLRARPEVATAGPAIGGAWALFRDGLPHIVCLNRPVGEEPDDSPLSDVPGRSRAAGAATPTGRRALLINAMGPGYLPEAQRLQPALAKASYPTSFGGSSLNDLRTLGEAPSFFFITCHGIGATVQIPDGSGGTTPFTTYGLSTTTPTSVATNNHLLAEGLQRQVMTGTFTTAINNGVATSGNVYLITHEWVRRFWRFSRDSLVWISACGSQDPTTNSALMVQACFEAGAGAYAGFTETVESRQSDRVQRYMIDRLIGANVLSPKEQTPQRAFDYNEVLADMTRTIGNSFPVANSARPVSLKITQNPTSEFGLLAPSIAYVLVDEPRGKAILKGSFGLETTEGKVFIGGQEVAVEVWGEDEIRCTLADDGPASAGDVYVEVRGRKSNVRRITRYTLQGTYRLRYEGNKPNRVEGGGRSSSGWTSVSTANGPARCSSAPCAPRAPRTPAPRRRSPPRASTANPAGPGAAPPRPGAATAPSSPSTTTTRYRTATASSAGCCSTPSTRRVPFRCSGAPTTRTARRSGSPSATARAPAPIILSRSCHPCRLTASSSSPARSTRPARRSRCSPTPSTWPASGAFPAAP